MMSGIKPITNYFKVKSKDELEVEELLLTQVSWHSKASALETAARTISKISSEVMNIVVDLSNDDSSSAGVYFTILISSLRL